MEKIEVNERAKFAKYVALNILANLGSSCYIVVDTFFVANGIGADGLTALNLAISLFSFQFSFGLLIGIGSGTRYGVSRSRGETKQGNCAFTVGMLLAVAAGLVFMAAGNLFHREIAALLGADGEIRTMTSVYLQVVMTCAPFYICNQVLVAFIRNDGNPKLATTALLLSNLTNIILDYVFIYLFHWSMFGAAAATGLAPVISISILSLHFLQKKNGFRLEPVSALHGIKGVFRSALDLCRLGISSMINELSVGLVVLIFNFLFLGLGGNIAVAAYGVVANVALFAIAIFTGIAQGIQPLVSEYHGRSMTGQLHIVRRDTVILALTLAAILVSIAFLFTGEIVLAFNSGNDVDLQAIAEEGLRFYFFSFFFSGINIAMAGYFSAMERADLGFLISLLRGLLIIAPAAFLLSRVFGMTGVWLAVPVTEAVTFVVTFIMIRRIE